MPNPPQLRDSLIDKLGSLLPENGRSLLHHPDQCLKQYLTHENMILHLAMMSVSLIQNSIKMTRIFSEMIIDELFYFSQLDITRTSTPTVLKNLMAAKHSKSHDNLLQIIQTLSYKDLLDIRNHQSGWVVQMVITTD